MLKSSQSPFSPIFVLAIGVLSVSTASIFIRFAQSEAPSFVIAAYRLSLSALFIAPFALWRKRQELITLSKNQFGLALFSGVFLAFHFASWISSLEYTSVASSVVVVTTVPLWVALISPITIHESVPRTAIIGIILALIGGIIVGISDSCVWNSGFICPSFSLLIKGKAFWGDILALIGAWMAVGYILIGRRLRSEVSLLSYIFIVYTAASIVLLLIMFSAGFSPFGYSAKTFIWFFLLAIIPQLLGHTTYNWALGYLPAAFVSVTLLGEPIGSALLAYFFLDEKPTSIKLIGAILILAGIYITSKIRNKSNVKEEI